MSTTTLHDAVQSGRLERTRVIAALDALGREPPAPEARDAVLRLGEAMLAGSVGERPQADVLERCVRLLARTAEPRALPFYRACSVLDPSSARGDVASVRGLALVALHAVDHDEARFLAPRLLVPPRANNGEPARSALAVLGAAGDDVALLLACHTALCDEIPLQMAALQAMSNQVPAGAFWSVGAAMMGDRFSDAVLAITDLIVEGRRADLLPGFAAAVAGLSDPDLLRAVLLSLLGARLDGVDAVFAAAVDGAPVRGLPGVEEALMLARIANQDALLHRLSERSRRGA